MLSGQRAVAHVLKRVYGCRYIPMKHIQTYVCMTALFNICYACTCANIRLSRTVCICIHTHAHTHTMYPVRLCVVSVYVSLLPQHPPPLSLSTSPLQHLHPHTVGAYRHPVRAVNRLSVCSRCRL